MRLPDLQALGQRLFVEHGHITLPVILGLVFLQSGLGHAFFNPTREVAIGVLELVASVFLFVAAFLVYFRHIAPALVCYGIALSCVVISLVMHVGILIRQLSR
jgi:hypothetical protein